MTVNEILFSLLREALFASGKGQVPEPFIMSGVSGKANQTLWDDVYAEAQKQAVLGLIASVVDSHSEIPERIREKWSGLQKTFAIRYVQMAVGQAETCALFQKAGIPTVVMKGMAAAIYYPIPEYRSMGDVDLLVSPMYYKAAVKLLKDNGYILKEEENQHHKYHSAFVRYNILYELHKSPSGVHRAEKGKAVAKYILSGLDRIEVNEVGQDQFPILPWKQNGMELLWHIRQHLYNGLGLRQIIDWMMFADYMLDDERMREYMPDIKRCGLDQLAIIVTKMCQKYLGLPHERITWCDGADESLCDELMEFIMGQGNFGVKAMNEKTAKVLSGYSNPIILLRKLQEVGMEKWELVKKYPILIPFAFLYGGFDAAVSVFRKEGGLKKVFGGIRLGQRRKRMFSKLYGGKKGGIRRRLSGKSQVRRVLDRLRGNV